MSEDAIAVLIGILIFVNFLVAGWWGLTRADRLQWQKWMREAETVRVQYGIPNRFCEECGSALKVEQDDTEVNFNSVDGTRSCHRRLRLVCTDDARSHPKILVDEWDIVDGKKKKREESAPKTIESDATPFVDEVVEDYLQRMEDHA